MRSGMVCPKDRGGCGKLLAWDDGAFCKECMTKAVHIRLKKMGIKQNNIDPFNGNKHNQGVKSDT